MNASNESISDAIVIYLAYGKALSPSQDRKAVLDIFGAIDPDIVFNVERILKEAVDTPIDWSKNDLMSAGKIARTRAYDRHSFLTEQALDAIEWKFTFDWR